MKFFLRRALLHCSLFVVLILIVLGIVSHFSDELYRNVLGTATTIISAFALINIFGEIAFTICMNQDDKSNLFKIMVIRTTKFLLYLILTIPFVWFLDNNKTFFGLLIVSLFMIYVIIEFSFFRNFKSQAKKD